MTPVIPPKIKLNNPPKQKSIGVLNLIFPPHKVAIQANTFTPVGTAMSIVVNINKFLIHMGVPV